MPEKVLNYSRSIVAQEKSWDCGPATAQIILNSAGIDRSEDWLISQIGTTEAGTNHAGLIASVLNVLLPGSGYEAVWISKEPVSKAQIEKLWQDIVKSIDGNRGVVLNFEAPPNNFPKAAYTSTVSPSYKGWNTIYHYVACMGYAVDAQGKRYVWIADPGFYPFGYWITLEQAATLIVPHAYAWASTAAPVNPQPQPQPQPAAPSWSQIGFGSDLLVAKSLSEIGYKPALDLMADMAAHGGGKDAEVAKVILSNIERTNPAVLQDFLKGK